MASQQQPARPWFRLASLAGRPAQQPPEPPAPQPRPRPTFRPVGQTQPQEPGQQGYGVSSVPTSPIRRTSVPTSPVQRTPAPPPPPTSTTISPPKPQIRAPTAPTVSLPTSPIRKPAPYAGSVITSPVKTTTVAAPVTTSPPKPERYTAPPVITTQPKPTTFSVPSSPIRTRATVTERVPSPKHSPVKPVVPTPEQSPKQKATAPPPSPLSLPPPQIRTRTEHEPKIPKESEKGVLVQQTIEKPREPRKEFEETHHRPGIAHHQRDGEAKKKTNHVKKLSSDSDEGGMRIITISGENKGAFMEVIKSPMRGNSPHTLHKNGHTTKTESDGSGWKSFSSSDEEGKSKKKDKSHDGKSSVSPHLGAYTNSNVQGINNSLVFNSSYSHHDPGVHLAFSRKPSGHGFQTMENDHNH